jgi:hypothetical protein
MSFDFLILKLHFSYTCSSDWYRLEIIACVQVQLTYLTLPWWTIIKDILDTRESPLLTF